MLINQKHEIFYHITSRSTSSSSSSSDRSRSPRKSTKRKVSKSPKSLPYNKFLKESSRSQSPGSLPYNKYLQKALNDPEKATGEGQEKPKSPSPNPDNDEVFILTERKTIKRSHRHSRDRKKAKKSSRRSRWVSFFWKITAKSYLRNYVLLQGRALDLSL